MQGGWRWPREATELIIRLVSVWERLLFFSKGPKMVGTPTMRELMDIVAKLDEQDFLDEDVQNAAKALKEAVEKSKRKNTPESDGQ